MRRILMTADTVGGVWTYALELINALAGWQTDVALATMGGSLSPAQRQEALEIPNLTLYESTFKLEWMTDPWRDVARAGDWLRELEMNCAPDIIHLNGYCHGSLPFRAPKIVVGHSCVLSWWEAVKAEEIPREWNRYRDEVRHGLSEADLVIAPSCAMREALETRYGLPAPIRVIYNGRSPRSFPPGSGKRDFIFAAGRLWDEAKNMALIDAVADRLLWPVYLAGDHGHSHGQPFAFSACTLMGCLSRQALAQQLAAASIFVHPARYEPFGLAVLEAALAECALVLGDIPSLRELWEGCAVFVSPDSAQDLESAVNDLIRDEAKRGGLAKRARQRASELTAERMAARYVSEYDCLGRVH